MLIHNGRLFADVMPKEKLSSTNWMLRFVPTGIACIEHVLLENNGQISVRALAAHESESR